MQIAPVNSFSNTVKSDRISFNSTEKKETINDRKKLNTAITITAAAAGIGILTAGSIFAHKTIKCSNYFKKLTNACEEFKNFLKNIVTPKNTAPKESKPLAEMAEELPAGLPASVDSYSPITISQRIAQYKANTAKFIEKEIMPVPNRGTVQTLPIENFHRWDNAAHKLTNVTKQTPSDTYGAFKICLNTFQKRYGLKDKEVGFIKEAMNMFADRTAMAIKAKETVDPRILDKKITPEQLFAEKISIAFKPTLEKDNEIVVQKLLKKVSEVIDF